MPDETARRIQIERLQASGTIHPGCDYCHSVFYAKRQPGKRVRPPTHRLNTMRIR